MKRFLLLFTSLTFVIALSISARSQSSHQSLIQTASQAKPFTAETGNSYGGATENLWQAGSLLPESVLIPGADTIPPSGHLQQQQSDGRALHCIQVDPSNPNNVHAVIMQLSSDYVKDTNLFTRRCFYTFSSDGGHTWKAPIALTDVKTGFPCMILYKRGGQYVPLIAAHHFIKPLLQDTVNTLYQCALWVEMGNPGDGNFEETDCSSTGEFGQDNILWPYIAVSPDGSTVYIVGSVSFTDALSSDFIHFGTFSLDAAGHATWNGWSQEIGANNTTWSGAGLVQSGDYVMRVSPSGKVGLLWRSADAATPATNLYFIESNDGGKTWPQTFDPLDTLVPLGQDQTGSEILRGPWTGLDFFYSGEDAKILWSDAEQSFHSDTNLYYPSVMALHFYDAATASDYELVSNITNDTAQNDLTTTLMPYPIGSQISETDDWLDYPTLAPSSNGNTFAVFYQTFPVNDSAYFSASTVKLYGSIYEQLTTDGGVTWSEPYAYRTNTAPAGDYGKIDFRWPQVSDWNGSTNAIFTPTVMYAADTAAGTNAKNGASDWDVIYFFHDTAMTGATLGVHGGGQIVPGLDIANYPNPAALSTDITFTLPQSSNVVLTVSDMLGRTVKTLAAGMFGAGTHSVLFRTDGMSNGVYRYTLEADGGSVSKSMSIMR